jgi:hypothetical protein
MWLYFTLTLMIDLLPLGRFEPFHYNYSSYSFDKYCREKCDASIFPGDKQELVFSTARLFLRDINIISSPSRRDTQPKPPTFSLGPILLAFQLNT